MRMLTVPAAAVALAVAMSVASASEMVGTIKSIDTAKDTITLDNGTVLSLPASIKIGTFKVGERVMVTYTETGNKMDVSAVAPAA